MYDLEKILQNDFYKMYSLYIYFQFFFTKISEDLSVAIKDYFKAVPDEVVTGSVLTEKSPNISEMEDSSTQWDILNQKGAKNVDILIFWALQVSILTFLFQCWKAEKLVKIYFFLHIFGSN